MHANNKTVSVRTVREIEAARDHSAVTKIKNADRLGMESGSQTSKLGRLVASGVADTMSVALSK